MDVNIKQLEIRDKDAYESVKSKLLIELDTNVKCKAITMKDRGPVIGLIGESLHFGYGFKRFRGYDFLVSNFKFPEAFKLITELGNLVVPKDWEYECITLNHGVKALKHRDKQNVGDSVIVAIGDFENGGITVWDSNDENPVAYNLKDTPLMFNGATHYHETIDFTGNRYTLIFYRLKRSGNIVYKGV